jgi:hypothetical protein
MSDRESQIKAEIAAILDALNSLNHLARGMAELTKLNTVEVEVHELLQVFEDKENADEL